nr:xylulose kinase-1 [Tanacetum cinerariifolium]
MATLRYRDEHNKVGYLLKPTGSDDYHQIINFLRATHIRYALTHNPIIFDSLVKQFWSTATLRSPELGPPAILATIDKTPYTITEDLVRSQLQLADDGGIDDLPIVEIYSIMDNLGLNFEGPPMPLLAAMLAQAQEGDDAGVAAQAVLQHMPAPDQPQDHLSTPSRQQTSDPNALVFEHGQSSDPNIAADPFTNIEDEPLEGSFHMSPPRSTQAPPAGQPSGGTEDLITLIALSSVVSTLVQKVNSLKTELKDHKKLFKDVVGKLVKKVKAMEVKLWTRKRKMVVSDSDQEEDGKQDANLDALLALANAVVTVDSNIPPGGASDTPAPSTGVPADVPTSVNVHTGSPSVPANVPHSVAPAGVSNKRKAPMVEEDIPVKERTFKQMQEDILGEQAAKRLHDEEQAQVDRQIAELQRRRQQKVLGSAMYYTEAEWIHIMAQVEANASLSKTLLGDDVSEDNFPARMAALIKRKKQALAEKLAKEMRNRPMTQGQHRTYMRRFVKNQSSAVYSTRWSMAYVKSFTDAQLKKEFEKIQKAQSNIQIQSFSRTLKRTGPVLEEPSSKRQKSTEAPIPSVPEVPQSPVVSSPIFSGTMRKSLGRKRITKPKSTLQELDLDADAQSFIKVISDEDSDDEAPLLWSAFIGWKDPVKLYGLVVKYYETHLVAGAGLILWGDLQVLFDSHKGETVSGEVVYMFADVSYPFSVKLMERMLKHKLEIDKDAVGNDMTTAVQLIQFIKNQLAAAQHADAVFSKDISRVCADFSSIIVKTQSSRYVDSTGRVVVPTCRYVVPAGNVIAVSTGRLSLIPTGRVLSP